MYGPRYVYRYSCTLTWGPTPRRGTRPRPTQCKPLFKPPASKPAPPLARLAPTSAVLLFLLFSTAVDGHGNAQERAFGGRETTRRVFPVFHFKGV